MKPEVSPPGAGPQTKVGSAATIAPGLGERIGPALGRAASKLKAGDVSTPLRLPARSRARPWRRWPAPWVATASSAGHEAIPDPASPQVQTTVRLRYQPLSPFGLLGESRTLIPGSVRSTTSVTVPYGPGTSMGSGSAVCSTARTRKV